MLRKIDVTQDFLDNIGKYKYDFGAESHIYKLNEKSVYKIFRKISDETLENKYQKLKLIDSKNIDFMPRILSALFCKDKFVGYEMPFYKNQFWNVCLTRDEKVNYLSTLKQYLLELEDKNITYVDLKEDNLFIENSKLILGDIDNSIVEDYRIDLIPSNICSLYDNGKFIVDCHSLMHNCFTINTLEDKFVVNLSRLESFESDMYTDDGKKLIKKMANVYNRPEQVGKDYLIDYLK